MPRCPFQFLLPFPAGRQLLRPRPRATKLMPSALFQASCLPHLPSPPPHHRRALTAPPPPPETLSPARRPRPSPPPPPRRHRWSACSPQPESFAASCPDLRKNL